MPSEGLYTYRIQIGKNSQMEKQKTEEKHKNKQIKRKQNPKEEQ